MLAAIRAVGRGLNNVRLSGYAYIWSNLAFLALSLPIVTLPAAWSALWRVGHVAQTEPTGADLDLFWETFKANLLRAMPWGAFMLAYGVVNFGNLLVYRTVDSGVISVLRIFWWLSTVLWAGILFYTWTIYYEMEQPTLVGATRNAAVMTLTNPVFTLVVLLSIVLIALVSVVLAALWVVLTWGAISAVSNAAVLDRLALFRASQERRT